MSEAHNPYVPPEAPVQPSLSAEEQGHPYSHFATAAGLLAVNVVLTVIAIASGPGSMAGGSMIVDIILIFSLLKGGDGARKWTAWRSVVGLALAPLLVAARSQGAFSFDYVIINTLYCGGLALFLFRAPVSRGRFFTGAGASALGLLLGLLSFTGKGPRLGGTTLVAPTLSMHTTAEGRIMLKAPGDFTKESDSLRSLSPEVASHYEEIAQYKVETPALLESVLFYHLKPDSVMSLDGQLNGAYGAMRQRSQTPQAEFKILDATFGGHKGRLLSSTLTFQGRAHGVRMFDFKDGQRVWSLLIIQAGRLEELDSFSAEIFNSAQPMPQ